jgi:DNA-binding NarL/FixJ family response regulator
MPEMQRRLLVVVALGDAASSGQLALRLSEDDGLFAVMATDLTENDHADVMIADDETASAMQTQSPPLLVLSSQATRVPVTVAAVLPPDAATALIAAAARLVAAGYRITRPPAELDERDETFDPADERLGSGLLADGKAEHEPSIRLSPREAQVLALLAEGAPNKVIARHLDISVHTAKFHVAAILAKLGAVNRTDAIAIAMRQGLLLV